MPTKVTGIFGSIVAIVGTAIVGRSPVIAFILFRSGRWGCRAFGTSIVTGAWRAVTEFLSFLTTLVDAF